MEQLTARDGLRRIASLGLPGANDAPFEVDSPDQLLLLADIQRMAVLLDRAVTSGTALAPTPDPGWTTRCRERAVQAAETTLAAHAAVMTAAPMLDECGVSATVLKGCATAHLDYSRAVERFSSDVDVMVAAGDRDRAVEILGGEVVDAIRSPRWNDRFAHAVTVRGPTGVEIDVHTRLQHGYVGFSVPPDQLTAAITDLRIGNRDLRCLDGPGRLLHAALNSGGVHPSLHSARDVPQLVLVGAVDWEESTERARRWRVDGYFARGVLEAWSMFDLADHPLTEWARNHHALGRQRLAARWTGRRAQVLAAPLALPPSAWIAYSLPLLRPDRDYVARTGKGWMERVSIIRDELRRRGPSRSRRS